MLRVILILLVLDCVQKSCCFWRQLHMSKRLAYTGIVGQSSRLNLAHDLRNQEISNRVQHLIDLLGTDDTGNAISFMQSLLGSRYSCCSARSNTNLYSDATVLNGVVRIFCTHSEPNFHMPWQRKKQELSTSSGFIIPGRRILTNAHAVEYGSLVQVKKCHSETKYIATVIAVGHECDLAVLKIQDPSFWSNTSSLSFGELPELLEDVSVVGFPVGGDSISITSGVVSRIEMQEYAQASADLLAIQIDAAINPGNSGGPVLNAHNEVIGVAFQSLSDDETENIGYVVPVPVIEHFLQSIDRVKQSPADRVPYAVCTLGCRVQPLESKALRQFLNMSEDDAGVRIASIASLAPANHSLQVDDVLVSVDGIPIGNDGTIPFREGHSRRERIHLDFYFTKKFQGDHVRLMILRNGMKHEVTVPLWVRQALIPRNLLMSPTNTTSTVLSLGRTPSYLMVGGLVFLTLTREYMESEFKVKHMSEFDLWNHEFHLLAQSGTMKRFPGEEIVIMSEVLAHPCNIGFELYRNMRIVECNGVAIENLRHLKEVVDTALTLANHSNNTDTRSGLLSFTCQGGGTIVLRASEIPAAQEQICQDHFIPRSFSLDLNQ